MVAVVGTALATVGTALGATTAATAVGAVAVGAATLGTVATVKSVKSAKASARAATAIADANIKASKAAETRRRRTSIRSFLRTRSRLKSAAAVSGIESSAAAGGLASLSSQFGANLGFGGQISSLNQQITALSGIQSTQAAMSGMYGNVADFGFNMLGRSVGIGSFIDNSVAKATGLDKFSTTGYT